MKRLYLLRHAQALGTGPSDKERALSDKGKLQAKALHEHVKEANYSPDKIACSPALRTKQTLDLVYPDANDVDMPEGFFYASSEDLITYIQETDDAHQSLLIVNHNPTIQQLVFSLCNHGDESALQSVAMGYQPCSLSVIDCPIYNWNDLRIAQNTLIALIPPSQ